MNSQVADIHPKIDFNSSPIIFFPLKSWKIKLEFLKKAAVDLDSEQQTKIYFHSLLQLSSHLINLLIEEISFQAKSNLQLSQILSNSLLC
jgi:hypothetical protein